MTRFSANYDPGQHGNKHPKTGAIIDGPMEQIKEELVTNEKVS